MADERPPAPFERPKEVARLQGHRALTFEERPDAGEMAAICGFLGLRGLRKMRFSGTLSPLGRHGWLLEGVLGASITQDCVATLEPVKTRIDTPVRLRFFPPEMIAQDTPEDVLEDDLEPLGPVIDLGHVAVEALALAMPDYPRIPSAPPLKASATPAGAEPITDEDTKAFAALAALKAKLDKEP